MSRPTAPASEPARAAARRTTRPNGRAIAIDAAESGRAEARARARLGEGAGRDDGFASGSLAFLIGLAVAYVLSGL